MKIRFGISTCPNDTFAMAGLLTGSVETEGLEFAIELIDIEQLNRRIAGGDFDVAKISFAAAARLPDWSILPVGSAIGFGVGPLLLAWRPGEVPTDRKQTTLCPGAGTTATLLMERFYPNTTRIEHVVFSDIMPTLSRREANFGVCIHEGRFTYADQGLHLVEDLGTRWERDTGSPLPLGGLVASNRLSRSTIDRVVRSIGRSLDWSRRDPDRALPTMRRYAQSFSDAVLMRHVDLYVNDWTVDLGPVGRSAIEHLFASAGTEPTFV